MNSQTRAHSKAQTRFSVIEVWIYGHFWSTAFTHLHINYHKLIVNLMSALFYYSKTVWLSLKARKGAFYCNRTFSFEVMTTSFDASQHKDSVTAVPPFRWYHSLLCFYKPQFSQWAIPQHFKSTSEATAEHKRSHIADLTAYLSYFRNGNGVSWCP